MSSVFDYCKHFRGVHEVCEAGIDPMKLRATNPTGRPFAVTWPCAPEGGHIACDHRDMPTEEEARAAAELSEKEMAILLAGYCPQCGRPLRRQSRPGGGYSARCPACPDVGVSMCRSRGDQR